MISFASGFQGEQHRSFRLDGTGEQAALLVHGFPGTPAEMRPLADLLHARGWTVEAVLLPGFGAEIDTISQRRAAEWRDAVQTAYDRLRAEGKRVVLAGNSMGGALALAAAGTHVPDALILFNPFWRVNHVLWTLVPALHRVIPTFRPFGLVRLDFRDPEVRRGILDFMPGIDLDDPAVQRGIREFGVPTILFEQIRQVGEAGYAAAPRVTCPTLIVQGSRDTLVLPSSTQRLASRLAGAVTYAEVAGEHNVLFTTLPAWASVCQHVTAFAATRERTPNID